VNDLADAHAQSAADSDAYISEDPGSISVAERARPSEARSRLSLAVTAARKQRNYTQNGLVDALRDVGEFTTQSYVARIERGLIVPSGRLIRGLARCLDVDVNHLLSLAAQDTYGIDPEKLFTLTNDTLSLDALADWEAQDKIDDLWVVTTSFVDNDEDKFQQAIKKILSVPGKVVTFFIPARENKRFQFYRRRMLSLTGREPAALMQVELSEDQVAAMAASYVLANLLNPKGKYEGYIILHNASGIPEVAVRMPKTQIEERALTLFRMREDALNAVAGASEAVIHATGTETP
jgi:transcriptional regulator with XRE-family HTH domain